MLRCALYLDFENQIKLINKLFDKYTFRLIFVEYPKCDSSECVKMEWIVKCCVQYD